jgi:hypothetical protein
MSALLWSRTTLVWLLLVVATALSWQIGHGVGISDAQIGSVAIIIVAFVKARFVIFEFMEIRDAPKWMQQVGAGWVVLIATLLIARLLIPA